MPPLRFVVKIKCNHIYRHSANTVFHRLRSKDILNLVNSPQKGLLLSGLPHRNLLRPWQPPSIPSQRLPVLVSTYLSWHGPWDLGPAAPPPAADRTPALPASPHWGSPQVCRARI